MIHDTFNVRSYNAKPVFTTALDLRVALKNTVTHNIYSLYFIIILLDNLQPFTGQ